MNLSEYSVYTSTSICAELIIPKKEEESFIKVLGLTVLEGATESVIKRHENKLGKIEWLDLKESNINNIYTNKFRYDTEFIFLKPKDNYIPVYILK